MNMTLIWRRESPQMNQILRPSIYGWHEVIIDTSCPIGKWLWHVTIPQLGCARSGLEPQTCVDCLIAKASLQRWETSACAPQGAVYFKWRVRIRAWPQLSAGWLHYCINIMTEYAYCCHYLLNVVRIHLAHRRSVSVLRKIFTIKSNTMHPLKEELLLPLVPARVTHGAFVANSTRLHLLAVELLSTAGNLCSSLYLNGTIFMTLHVFDDAGLAGFNSRANDFFLT